MAGENLPCVFGFNNKPTKESDCVGKHYTDEIISNKRIKIDFTMKKWKSVMNSKGVKNIIIICRVLDAIAKYTPGATNVKLFYIINNK